MDSRVPNSATAMILPVTVATLLVPQRGTCPAPGSGGSGSSGLITHATTAGEHEQLTVVDPDAQTWRFTASDTATGEIRVGERCTTSATI